MIWKPQTCSKLSDKGIKYELNVIWYDTINESIEYNIDELTDKLLLDIADKYNKLKNEEQLQLWLINNDNKTCTKYLITNCVDFVYMLDAKNYINKIDNMIININNEYIPIITDESIKDIAYHGLSLKLINIYIDSDYKEEKKENE